MSKRFVDIAIWKKGWFRKLPPEEKAAWKFICDDCDGVGVWEADFDIAEAFIGATVNWDHLLSSCNGNIEVMKNGKWWLCDFVDFQYGELNENCRPHRHYLALLEKHGLKGFQKNAKGYQKGINTLKEKEKEKELEPEPEKEPDDFVAFWDVYPRKVNKVGALKAWRARLREKSATPGALITSAQNYATKVAGKDPEYIMHPSTFLGPQQRWKDYPAAAHPASRVVHKFCGSCGKEYWGSACDCGWSE